LFGLDASSPYYHEGNKVSIFYAESWVLTHYLMTKDWQENTYHLKQFVSLLGQNVPPEVAAKRTIGDPKALDDALARYVEQFTFTADRIPAPPEVNEKAFVAESISDAESLAIRGDFLVHTRRYPEARKMLEESLKDDPKLASAYESMGLLYAEQQQIDEANKWYSQSIALNSQSYFANYYYATNLFRGTMSDENAAKAEECLRTSIKINPDFAPSHDALAFLLTFRGRNLNDARMSALLAISLEPGNIRYRFRMVEIL